MRAALDLAEKIRRINGYVHQTGACPVTECLPYPSDEYMLVPVVIEAYLKDLEKAIWWNDRLASKRSAAA
ncbi:MAG: hypothetical protein ACREC0_03145 [Methylocella sp.]